MPVVLLSATCFAFSVAAASALPSSSAADGAAASGLTAEIYANSVMRGTPACTMTVPNGWKAKTSTLCAGTTLVPGEFSIRLTGTLAAPGSPRWHNFTATVGTTAMVRLWVDDHRLVDAWHPRQLHENRRAPAAAASAAAVLAGWAFWPHSDIHATHGEFPTGKLDKPSSVAACGE
jgi:hypothetical protein